MRSGLRYTAVMKWFSLKRFRRKNSKEEARRDTATRALLAVSVFVAGAVVLAVELVAFRVLAPYFGNTIYTSTSVISVVLLALSIGYFFGGRIADRYPKLAYFFWSLALGGVGVLGVAHIVTNFLPGIASALPVTYGPLVVSMLLFFVPSVILGMATPYAVKLAYAEAPERGVGSVAGELSFFSTLGSIVGSITTGFFLVPHVPLLLILNSAGVVLVLLGLVPLLVLRLFSKRISVLGGVSAILLIANVLTPQLMRGDEGEIYRAQGLYSQISVREEVRGGRDILALKLDRNSSSAAYLDDSEELVYDYTKYVNLYQPLEIELERALVLGAGAYSVPKALVFPR